MFFIERYIAITKKALLIGFIIICIYTFVVMQIGTFAPSMLAGWYVTDGGARDVTLRIHRMGVKNWAVILLALMYVFLLLLAVVYYFKRKYSGVSFAKLIFIWVLGPLPAVLFYYLDKSLGHNERDIITSMLFVFIMVVIFNMSWWLVAIVSDIIVIISSASI